jgi:hypothetical protein
MDIMDSVLAINIHFTDTVDIADMATIMDTVIIMDTDMMATMAMEAMVVAMDIITIPKRIIEPDQLQTYQELVAQAHFPKQ